MAQSAPPLPFDAAQLPSLPGGWSVLNADKGQFRALHQELTIAPVTGTDLFFAPDGGYHQTNVPLAMFAPEGDFTLTTKVSARLDGVYDVAALVVWLDEHHWAKLCFENSAKREATVVSVVTRELSDDTNSENLYSPFVWMAVARHGNEFSLHFSRDGRNWRLVRHFQLQVAGKLRLGFMAETSTNPNFAATFSQIDYRPTAPKDMRQLEPTEGKAQ